jgi:RHS repeat-associated protein
MPEQQPYKFGGKELDEMHGLNWYDQGARPFDAIIPRTPTMDPMAEKYYNTSPYAQCLNNPVNNIDPDGRSTWVKQQENGTYEVFNGDLNDKDVNIYVYTQDKNGNYTVRGESIGVTTSTTSFYNDTKNDATGKDYGWMGTINPNDNSGEQFLGANIYGNKMTLDEYMANANLGEKYDFKSIGLKNTGGDAREEHFYRGTVVGKKDGTTVYTSARDVGNMSAGYVAASNGMTWTASRLAFDAKQGGIEGVSTRNAEAFGFRLGSNNTHPFRQVENLRTSISGALKRIWNYFTK